MFTKNKINLKYIKFELPIYQQNHVEFVPNLSVMDILFNCGSEETQNILKMNINILNKDD